MISYFKIKTSYIIALLILAACSFMPVQKKTSDEIAAIQKKSTIPIFAYDSLTIPQFFKALTKNHCAHFYVLDSANYLTFCKSFKIKSSDTDNLNTFFTINILHHLFTSESASNFSKGPILNIPYMWHWTTPNPRYSIYMTETGKKLKDMKPPAEFSKYKSYADIDRTPYLYLSDLASPHLKYRSEDFDTFATFGWCSEREMAYVALLQLLNFKGSVVVSGNHSWTELIVPYHLASGSIANFTATVDNTFNSISYTPYNKITPTSNWYDRTAHSERELLKIKRHQMSQQAMDRIEQQVTQYLSQ